MPMRRLLYPMIILTIAAPFVMGCPRPASAQVSPAALQAGQLTATPTVTGHHFSGLRIRDKISQRTIEIPEAFVLVLKDNTELRSTDMHATVIGESILASDPHRALSGERETTASPASACWNFTSANTTTSFDWCVIARRGSNYARTILRIHATTQDLSIAEVRLLDFTDPSAHVDGTVKGSPVIDNNLYFGFEHPLAVNTATEGHVRASLLRDLPLRTGQSIVYSAVLGTSQPGQLRRAFLAYIEEERPRPYRPFLHYNSWYDLGYENRFDESGAIDRVNAFGQQLEVNRHVQLDSYLFDDGWDNPNSLWGFNSGFPNGFTKTGATAAKYKAGIGVWLSPWGGYAEQKDQRIAFGHAHGYEILNEGFALSGPKYYDLFEQTCLQMIDKYNVNQFKFDGTGNADRVFLRPDRKWMSGQTGNSMSGQTGSSVSGRTTGPDSNQAEPTRIFYYQFFDPDKNVFANITVFEFQPGTFNLTRRIFAQSARWDDNLNGWVFEDGWQRTFQGESTASYKPFTISTFPEIHEQPSYFKKEDRQSEQMSYKELATYINDLKQSGFDTMRLRVQLNRKMAYPIMTLVLAILAIPFSLFAGKRGGIAGVGTAIGVAICYWVIAGIFENLGDVNSLPAVLAAWSPDLLFAFAGTYLLLRTPT